MSIQRPINRILAAASLAWMLGACSSEPVGSPDVPTINGGDLDPYVAHKDARSGLPTFVWLSPRSQGPAGKDATSAGWAVLRELRTAYRMSASAMDTVQLQAVHEKGRGAVMVKFSQQVDGLEVFLRGVTVALNRGLRSVAASGNFALVIRRTADAFVRPAEDAVAAALQQLFSRNLSPGAITVSGKQDQYTLFTIAPLQLGYQRYVQDRPARTKQVLYPAPEGLVPAYYVELSVRNSNGSDARAQSFVVSAADGKLLFQNDLVAYDAYTYRVWADPSGKFTPHVGPYGESFFPHPTGSPDFSRPTSELPSNRVTLQNVPFSQNDPWLFPGATVADGNNVQAFADIAAPDGFDPGDLVLLASAPGEFDYSIGAEDDPTANDAARSAGITQLFYTLNYLHDTFYDAGWDENSGNPQQTNYGRGGLETDPILGQAQDNAGFNNANASTPADGASPRIQMYLWNNPTPFVDVQSPTALVGQYSATTAVGFGAQDFKLTGNLVLVDDGMGVSPTDGCEVPFVNAAAVAGNIAVIDRGLCPFTVKAKNAQDHGAIGVLFVNNAPGLIAPGGTDPTVTIPALCLTLNDGTPIKTALSAGTPVAVTMFRTLLNRDGALDNSLVAHEWGHILSNRLIGNAAGLSANQARGLGEGWGDFVALLSLVRPEAALSPANVNWSGAFPVFQFSKHFQKNSYYFGSRRYPYSTDLNKNPLTYKHISTGVPLPTMPAPGPASSDNAEVHNTGEVWASMLWDCYTNMLRDTGRYTFDQAQQTMREYLVAGMKLTPMKPTLLEARDALLAAMYARDSKDYTECAASFAKRGAGNGAVAADRDSDYNAGAVESFEQGPDLTFVSFNVDDSARSCDNDGIVDNLETGRLEVTIRNIGVGPLHDAKVTVVEDSPFFHFENGRVGEFPSSQPYETSSAHINFLLKDAIFPFTPTLTLKLTAASLAASKTITVPVKRRMSYDVAPNASTTETFGVPSAGWSTSGDTTIQGLSTPWKQTFNEDGVGSFKIPDNAVRSDQYLVSPEIVASATEELFISIKHRYSFESDRISINFDGGVIEYSFDNGANWYDVNGRFIQGDYNGLVTYIATDPPEKQNPLTPGYDAPGFVGLSPGYPNYNFSTINMGTAFAGLPPIRLRFRVGTNYTNDEIGWEIAEVQVTGAANKPFPLAVPQTTPCANRPPVVTVATAEQRVAGGATGYIQGAVSDPDLDPVTHLWVQTSGPSVVISDPTALNQTLYFPEVKEEMDVTFALRASDGRSQSEAVAKVTLVPGEGGKAGCSCRTVPTKTRVADLAATFLCVALAGLYCRRRPRNRSRATA